MTVPRQEPEQEQQQEAGAAEPARSGVDAPPELPATGDPEVEQAVQALHGALQRPLGEQVQVYTDVHGLLQDRLADLDG